MYPQFIIKKKENNTQLITMTNKGYMPFTQNLLCSMKTCNFAEKLKIYCLDEECYQFFKLNYKENTVELVNNNNINLSDYAHYVAPQQEDSEEKKSVKKIPLFHNDPLQKSR